MAGSNILLFSSFIIGFCLPSKGQDDMRKAQYYSCDFEDDFCGYTITVWPYYGYHKPVRRQANSYHGFNYPAFDHTIGPYGKVRCLKWWSPMYNGYCYKFEHGFFPGWLGALRECKRNNAWLVDIRDDNEWNFIINQMSRSYSSKRKYFIGLRKDNGTKDWTYPDGSVANLTNLWLKDKYNISDSRERCGAIVFDRSRDDARFTDISCDYPYMGYHSRYVICKSKLYRRRLGHYLVLSEERRSRGKIFTFVSPMIPTNFSCLTFYYYMNGEDLNPLKVIVGVSWHKEVLVWQLGESYSYGKTNNSGVWNKAQIPLNTMDLQAKFRIMFRTARNIYQSSEIDVIGIDDINITTIHKGECRFYPPIAKPPTWDMTGSCSFDSGTCGYTNDQTDTDNLGWFKKDMPSPRMWYSRLPPSYEHTSYSSQTGSYVFVQHAMHQSPGQTARFISPSLSPRQAKCLSFYYYFSGKRETDAELTVFIRPTKKPSIFDETPVWRMTNKYYEFLNFWYKGITPLIQRTNFQVVFEGFMNYNTGIALDDIMMSSSTSCYPMTSFASVTEVKPIGRVIRLASPTTNGTGRVEVYHRGRWGTVCGNVWTLNNAHVVCRQLGFEGALTPFCCGMFGQGEVRVWLSDVSCLGKEGSIATCSHKGWGNNQCKHGNDAGVACKTSNNTELQLRLRGGSTNYQGRVDVKYIGIWGTIHDNGWDILDATVVCRQLGFAGAISALTGSTFGQGEGPVWFSNVHCNGSEGKLSQCVDYNSKISNQNHKSDASVECFNARLSNDTKANSGRVEIQYRGKWGAVCGTNWNMNAAHVICRDLGYQRAKSTSLLAKGSEDVLLDQVKCNGDEASIMLCLHLGFNIHKCDSSKLVGVECLNEKRESHCRSNPCKNDGKCTETKESFSCGCTRNFTGQKCQIFIGTSIVGILLKGDVNKWDQLKFKNALSEMLNTYCSDCSGTPFVRSRRASEKEKSWKFTSQDIIIVKLTSMSTAPPLGLLYLEFAVVKTISGTAFIIDPAKLVKTISQGGKDGIPVYDVLEINLLPYNRTSFHQSQREMSCKDRKTDTFKIGFIAVLVILVSCLVLLAVVCFIQRGRKTFKENNKELKAVYRRTKCEKLLNEDFDQLQTIEKTTIM